MSVGQTIINYHDCKIWRLFQNHACWPRYYQLSWLQNLKIIPNSCQMGKNWLNNMQILGQWNYLVVVSRVLVASSGQGQMETSI